MLFLVFLDFDQCFFALQNVLYKKYLKAHIRTNDGYMLKVLLMSLSINHRLLMKSLTPA